MGMSRHKQQITQPGQPSRRRSAHEPQHRQRLVPRAAPQDACIDLTCEIDRTGDVDRAGGVDPAEEIDLTFED